MLRQAKVDLALKGIPREKIDEQEKKMREELEPEANSQVKVYLILSAIAKKENITQDEHMPRRVMEFLFREANWNIIT
jgi:FKBP-type peptidyl-prolyl cis-trans isomerase (trigger factor)